MAAGFHHADLVAVANVTIFTLNTSPPSGSNLVLYAWITCRVTFGHDNVPTWDGTDMTEVGTEQASDGTSGFMQTWRLINPAADGTSKALVVDWNVSNRGSMGVIFVADTDQTTPDDGVVDVKDTAVATISHAVTSATDDLVISCVSVANTSDPTFVAGASQTARFDGGGTGSAHARWQYGTTEPGAPSVTMDHSWTGDEDPIQRSFNINAASVVGAATVVPVRRLRFYTQEG